MNITFRIEAVYKCSGGGWFVVLALPTQEYTPVLRAWTADETMPNVGDRITISTLLIERTVKPS